jgi:hypothetical protein
MPLLGEKPPMRTDRPAGRAEEQAKDEEVAFMWGILDDGNSDRASAVRRLATIASASPSPKS